MGLKEAKCFKIIPNDSKCAKRRHKYQNISNKSFQFYRETASHNGGNGKAPNTPPPATPPRDQATPTTAPQPPSKLMLSEPPV